MPITTPQYPMTDHLWQLGFRLESKVHRLHAPIVVGDEAMHTTFELAAFPERGEARRHFGRKAGPAKSEVKSNLMLEYFQAEKEQGSTELKDTYTEKCAVVLFDMLRAEVPGLSEAAHGC